MRYPAKSHTKTLGGHSSPLMADTQRNQACCDEVLNAADIIGQYNRYKTISMTTISVTTIRRFI